MVKNKFKQYRLYNKNSGYYQIIILKGVGLSDLVF